MKHGDWIYIPAEIDFCMCIGTESACRSRSIKVAAAYTLVLQAEAMEVAEEDFNYKTWLNWLKKIR